MITYLVRHGVAEPDTGSGDFTRALTADGIRKMQAIVSGLRRLKIRPAAVWASPLRRTRETAELLAAGLDLESVQLCDWMAPGGEPDVLCKLGTSLPDPLMLVGHQPDLGRLASLMLAGTDADASLTFKKGAVACIRGDGAPCHGARLEWFLTPAQLRLIGRD
ncbi:MAG: SixA phosphatase family protein [Pseudomonadota bacterium]